LGAALWARQGRGCSERRAAVGAELRGGGVAGAAVGACHHGAGWSGGGRQCLPAAGAESGVFRVQRAAVAAAHLDLASRRHGLARRRHGLAEAQTDAEDGRVSGPATLSSALADPLEGLPDAVLLVAPRQPRVLHVLAVALQRLLVLFFDRDREVAQADDLQA